MYDVCCITTDRFFSRQNERLFNLQHPSIKLIDMFEVLDNKVVLGFERFHFRLSLSVTTLKLNSLLVEL